MIVRLAVGQGTRDIEVEMMVGEELVAERAKIFKAALMPTGV